MKNPPRNLKIKKPSLFRKIIFICLILVIAFALLVLILTPLRVWGAKKYLTAGDQKLADLQYVSAEIEYQKAGILTPLSVDVRLRIDLAQQAETDIIRLRDFFKANDQRSSINDFKAIDTQTDPVELTKLSKNFIERSEPQMAVVAAQKATRLKVNYRDGLLYLAIAYDRAARVGTIRKVSVDYLMSKSQSAYLAAKESDPAFFAEFREKK